MPLSLMEYETAERRKGKLARWFETHPDIQEELHAGYTRGLTPWFLARWLADEQGFAVTQDTLRTYLRRWEVEQREAKPRGVSGGSAAQNPD